MAKKTIKRAAPTAVGRKKVRKKAAKKGAKVKKRKKLSRKEVTTQYSGGNLGAATSRLLLNTLQELRLENSDHGIAAAGELGKIIIGVPIPLVFQYLIQNNVLPLSRFIQVVGEEGSNKSTLTFEFIRWFAKQSGFGYYFENESKVSPDLGPSIFGYPDEIGREVMGHIPCYSMEYWQQKLTEVHVKVMRHMIDVSPQGDPAPGRVYPVCYIVDSMMGKLSEESQGLIEAQGFSGRAFPIEALSLTNFLKKVPQDYAQWPCLLVGVNHLKKHKEQGAYRAERKKAGGKQKEFQETFEIEVTRKGKIDLDDTDADGGFSLGGRNLRMTCYKNSLGESFRSVDVDLHWVNRMTAGSDGHKPEQRQYTSYDWSGAIVDLIESHEGKKLTKLKSVVNLQKGKGGMYHCSQLGVNRTNPLTKSEIGKKIQNTPAVRRQLQILWGIKRRKIFKPGKDYLLQLAEARIEAEEQVEGA